MSRVLLLRVFLLASVIFLVLPHNICSFENNEICFGHANNSATGNDPMPVPRLYLEKMEMSGPWNWAVERYFSPQ